MERCLQYSLKLGLPSQKFSLLWNLFELRTDHPQMYQISCQQKVDRMGKTKALDAYNQIFFIKPQKIPWAIKS